MPLNAFLFFLNNISALVLSLDDIVDESAKRGSKEKLYPYIDPIYNFLDLKYNKFVADLTYVLHPRDWDWEQLRPKLLLSFKITGTDQLKTWNCSH